MNVVVPFGFFGAGNIGDEAMLQAFATLVARYHSGLRVWVASRTPSPTARVDPFFKYYRAIGLDPRRRWARHRAGAYALVGGTPVTETQGAWPLSEVAPLVSAAHEQRKPVVAVGIGTERLERSEEHTSELQSQSNLVCRLLLEKKKKMTKDAQHLNLSVRT